MKLCVFGAGGQVGTEIVREALRRGRTVRAFSRAEADLADAALLARIVATCDADVVINAGAYTAVDAAESDAAAAFAVNRDGPAALAAACAVRKLPLVHFSTDYVFDGAKRAPYVEEDAVGPLSVYGRSKEEGERAVRDALPEHVILRTSWVYAAHGRNFVRTMLRLAADRDELKIVDDQRGAPTSAADIARVVGHVAERLVAARTAGRDAPYGTYHCTAYGETTWRRFAEAIFELAGPRLAKRPRTTAIRTADYPTAAVRPMNSVLDCSRLRAAFDPPRRDWSAGLAEVLDRLFGEDATK